MACELLQQQQLLLQQPPNWKTSEQNSNRSDHIWEKKREKNQTNKTKINKTNLQTIDWDKF